MRESLLQDTLRSVSGRGERRGRVLAQLTERAEQHAQVFRDYQRISRENEKLRHDLQVLGWRVLSYMQ